MPPTPEREFETLDEVKEAYNSMGKFSQTLARIVEAYQVTRYKAVKV